MTIVLHHLGAGFRERLSDRYPDVTFTEIDDPPSPGTAGDVFVTTAMGSPHLAELCSRGITWVHSLGTGVERFPVDQLPPDVLFTCTRGASGVPISEYVLAAMLDHVKGLATLFVHEPPEHWSRAQLGGLAGQTVAVIGLGGIGVEVARRCLAFGMHVRAIRRRPEPPPLPSIELVPDLPSALAGAHHVVVAVPVTSATTHLLDEAAFTAMAPGVHVVNVARGTVLDQDALRRALDSGHVARATLDVCDPEPLPAGHWLYTHPGVRLSPHVSWSAPGALHDLHEFFAANLARFLAGQPLQGIVDREAGY